MATDVERVLRRLRSCVKFLAGVVILLALCQGVCLWCLFGRQVPEVRAQRFVLENPTGAICGEWGVIGKYPFFRLGGDPGGAGAMLTAGGPPTLTFFGETGTPRVGISALSTNPRIRLWDARDNLTWESP